MIFHGGNQSHCFFLKNQIIPITRAISMDGSFTESPNGIT